MVHWLRTLEASWYFIWGCSIWDQQENTRAMTSWPAFHGPLTSDFGQIVNVKIFGQGRISRPVNSSKLIFHMRMYLYETSRNIQDLWPPDLYFMVHWPQTLARLSTLRFLAKVESQDLLMVASWYFIWGCISMRPAVIYKAMTSWPIVHGPLTSDFFLSAPPPLSDTIFFRMSCDFMYFLFTNLQSIINKK